jgi:hypothetical protein
LSPRYIRNGWPCTTRARAHGVGQAQRRPGSMTCRPQREPSPTALRTSAAVWPTMMPTSVMPARRSLRAWNRIGVPATASAASALVCDRRSRSPRRPTTPGLASDVRLRAGVDRRPRRRDGLVGGIHEHDHVVRQASTSCSPGPGKYFATTWAFASASGA